MATMSKVGRFQQFLDEAYDTKLKYARRYPICQVSLDSLDLRVCDLLLKEDKMMTVRQPRYSKEEFARRGTEIYDADIRSQVETDHQGKFVAIDIETRHWDMDADDYTATERLLRQLPDAQIWLVRVGHRAAYRIGGPRRIVESR